MSELVKHQPQVPAVPQLDVAAVQSLGQLLAKSGYFADARETAQAAVKVLAGAELGIPPIAAMTGIHIVKGKVTLGAALIGSRIRAHGYDYRVLTLDDTGCKLEFIGKDKKPLGISEFTIEDAKSAGLTVNDTYKRFPRNMFMARAISNGARWYTPDVFGGAPVFTPEELGAPVDAQGEVTQPTETKAQVLDRRLTEERNKLAEMRKADEDLPPELAEKPWKTFKGMLDLFATVKAAVGEDTYYRCLDAHGVQHANDFKGKGAGAALDCYNELLNVAETLGNVESEAQPA